MKDRSGEFSLRIALQLGYLGNRYHGFQIQPHVPTIEDKLFNALEHLGIIDNPKKAKYSAAGRTDRGVHALGQVVAFNTDKPELTMPRILNSKLPDDIWVWGRAEVSKAFDPRRKAVSREYRYLLYREGLDISKMRIASTLLVGTHDFANFSTRDAEKSTKRTMKRIEIRISGPFITLDITADSFTWNMVRKIVTGLSMVGGGSRDLLWLRSMLKPDKYVEVIKSAPSFGLTLKKVNYSGIKFTEDEYAKKAVAKALRDQFIWYGTMAEVVRSMKDSMGHQNSDGLY